MVDSRKTHLEYAVQMRKMHGTKWEQLEGVYRDKMGAVKAKNEFETAFCRMHPNSSRIFRFVERRVTDWRPMRACLGSAYNYDADIRGKPHD